MTARADGLALVQAAHAGPTVVVTVLAALLAVAAGTGVASGVVLAGAVLCGQLTIGWLNDVQDAERDRSTGRTDKPLATGRLAVRTVRLALGWATAGAVVLSLALGWRAAVVHLVLVLGSGWAYDLGVKATVWSWLPYALAFGALPAVAWLAAGPGWSWPPVWMMAAGATLGVGAHLLNALPDLGDDDRTGVRGLPHRLGPTGTRLLGPALLWLGSVIVTVVPGGTGTGAGTGAGTGTGVVGVVGAVPAAAWAALALCTALVVLAWTSRGRMPFVAAMLLALVTVGGLLLR